MLTSGETWQSSTSGHRFKVVGGPETFAGLQGWPNRQFVGVKAERVDDGALALVALTEKPRTYASDFVLIQLPNA